MATESPLICHTHCTAAADLSAKQFFAVKVTAGRSVNLASTGGEAANGILQNDPIVGQAANVGFLGISKAVAGAAFSAGALLMTDTAGKLITATSTNYAIAQAIEAAGVANQIVTVMVKSFGKV